MKIKASTPDFTAYFSLAISILVLISAVISTSPYGLFYISAFSFFVGVNFAIIFMRLYGWILPEKE